MTKLNLDAMTAEDMCTYLQATKGTPERKVLLDSPEFLKWALAHASEILGADWGPSSL